MDEKLKRIRERREKLANKSKINLVPSQDAVDVFLNSGTNNDLHSVIEERLHTNISKDIEIKKEDVQTLLKTIEEGFQEQTLDDLLNECKKTVLDTCIRQFGLAKILFEDKDGGNVTTIHNAQQKIYAKEDDGYNRTVYESGKNSEGKSFKGKGKNSVGSEFTRSQLDEDGTITDAYTGKTVKGSDTSPDHIESLSKFHRDGGFMLSDQEKADFATDKGNLASTQRDINQSMKDSEKLEWVDRKSNGRDITNEENFDIDRELLEEKVAQGREVAKKHAPTAKDKTIYYAKNIGKTGAKEGVKMGIQQGLGLVLRELTLAIFDEAKDIIKNGMLRDELGDSFWESFKARLQRISERILMKWQDVAVAFKDGFISGFISNLITVVTNTFKTTFRNINKIIREGVYSLFKAIKLLAKPPEEMSQERVYQEVTKLIAGSIVVSGGIILEEILDKYLKAFPFANIISDVLIGTLTGVLTCIVLFSLDKIDIFGCNRQEKHDFIILKLNKMIENDVKEALEA